MVYCRKIRGGFNYEAVKKDQNESVSNEPFCHGSYGLRRQYPMCLDWAPA